MVGHQPVLAVRAALVIVDSVVDSFLTALFWNRNVPEVLRLYTLPKYSNRVRHKRIQQTGFFSWQTAKTCRERL
jgi:hypothetical protein